jgi:hypothetical protein
MVSSLMIGEFGFDVTYQDTERPLRVPRQNGLHQRRLTVAARVEIQPSLAQQRQPVAAALVKELAVKVHQPRTVAGRDQGNRERPAGLVPFQRAQVVRAPGDPVLGLAQRVMGGDDPAFPGGLPLLHRQAQRDPFDLSAHEADVGQVLRGGGGHPEPALRRRLHQPLGRENAERFAHGMVRSAIPLAQGVDLELLVRQQCPEGNVAPERGGQHGHNRIVLTAAASENHPPPPETLDILGMVGRSCQTAWVSHACYDPRT